MSRSWMLCCSSPHRIRTATLLFPFCLAIVSLSAMTTRQASALQVVNEQDGGGNVGGGNVAGLLDTPIQISTSTPNLREIATTLQQSLNIAVLVDRRIDPTRIVFAEESLQTAPDELHKETLTVISFGPELRAGLDRISQLTETHWSSDGFAIFVAPDDAALRTASFAMRQWDELNGNPQAISAGLTERRRVSWDELATPNEILQRFAAQWNLDASTIRLPHDHWPAANLGSLPISTALAAIGIGFDRIFEIDPATMTLTEQPLPAAITVNRHYRLEQFSRADENRIRRASKFAAPRFQRVSGGVLLTADASGHLEAAHVLTSAHAAKTRKGRPRGGNTGPANPPKYTLRLAEQSGKALRYLAQSAQIAIRIDPSAEPLLEARIELEVKDKTIDELMRMVAKEAGVTVSNDGETLVFSAP